MRQRLFAGFIALAATVSCGCVDSDKKPATVPDKLLEPPGSDMEINPRTGKPMPVAPDAKNGESTSDN